jgi:hypothetical protein
MYTAPPLSAEQFRKEEFTIITRFCEVLISPLSTNTAPPSVAFR